MLWPRVLTAIESRREPGPLPRRPELAVDHYVQAGQLDAVHGRPPQRYASLGPVDLRRGPDEDATVDPLHHVQGARSGAGAEGPVRGAGVRVIGHGVRSRVQRNLQRCEGWTTEYADQVEIPSIANAEDRAQVS